MRACANDLCDNYGLRVEHKVCRHCSNRTDSYLVYFFHRSIPGLVVFVVLWWAMILGVCSGGCVAQDNAQPDCNPDVRVVDSMVCHCPEGWGHLVGTELCQSDVGAPYQLPDGSWAYHYEYTECTAPDGGQ